MKKHYRPVITCLGISLIALSNLIARTHCFSFIGEPDVPKCMLK